MKSIDQAMNRALKNARKELAKTGTLRTKFFLTDAKGQTQVIVLPIMPGDPAGKDLLDQEIRRQVSERGSISWVMVANVWCGEDRIREQEGFFAVYEDIEGSQMATLQEYHRDFGGRIRFGRIVGEGPCSADGRFVRLAEDSKRPIQGGM